MVGVRVALTLGIVGLLGLLFLLPEPQLSVVAERSWNSLEKLWEEQWNPVVLAEGAWCKPGTVLEGADPHAGRLQGRPRSSMPSSARCSHQATGHHRRRGLWRRTCGPRCKPAIGVPLLVLMFFGLRRLATVAASVFERMKDGTPE